MSQAKAPTQTAPTHRMLAALYLGYLLLSLMLFRSVVEAGFLSDDWQVIAHNPYVQGLSFENLREIVDPFGPGVLHAMNYAPIHLLVHAIQIELFGQSMLVFHLTNIILHATTGWLLARLLVSSRLPFFVAAGVGGLFIVHPANVEAVAYIFQTKTLLSTALGLAAVLLYWRHPAASIALFAAAMLTKLSALFAFPVVLLWSHTRHGAPDREVPSPLWLVAWALVLAAVAVPELAAFQRTGEYVPTLGDSTPELFRSIVAIAGRYLWMAATSFGVSAYHQVAATGSWSDPWFLLGLAGLVLLGWRSIRALLRREEEVGYWALAFASFLPISQIFPFVYPMADRYLYAVLPGLFGGCCLAGRAAYQRFDPEPDSRRIISILLAVAALVGVGFAWRTVIRAPLFQSEARLQIESARNYPDGIPAWMRRAQDAGRRGDAAGVADAMQKLRARGFLSVAPLLANPQIGRHAAHPKVRSVVRAMAHDQVERLSALEDPHQIELFLLAQAHLQRDERPAAVTALEQALEIGGPEDAAIQAALDALAAP